MYYNIFILALFTFIVLFFSIFFRYNALFNCTSNNILLTIGIICSLFLGPDEQCKILNVRLQCGQWQETQRQDGYVLLGQQLSHPTETRFDQIRCWKSNETQLCLRTVGYAWERGAFHSIVNIKYFIQSVKFRWPAPKLMWPPNFPSFSSGPLENRCGSLGTGAYSPLCEPLQHVMKFFNANTKEIRFPVQILRPKKRLIFRYLLSHNILQSAQIFQHNFFS